MATLTCSRCNATTEADSIDEGRQRLDHAVGLVIGMPCEDGRAELYISGKVKSPKPVKPKSKNVGNKKPDSISKD